MKYLRNGKAGADKCNDQTYSRINYIAPSFLMAYNSLLLSRKSGQRVTVMQICRLRTEDVFERSFSQGHPFVGVKGSTSRG